MNYLKWDCDRWFVIRVAGRGETFISTKPSLCLVESGPIWISFAVTREWPVQAIVHPDERPNQRSTSQQMKSRQQHPMPKQQQKVRQHQQFFRLKIQQQPKQHRQASEQQHHPQQPQQPHRKPIHRQQQQQGTTSTTTTNTPMTFDCAGKADGNYPASNSICSATFYMCSNGNAYLFVSLK
jgi:hypothetical protein